MKDKLIKLWKKLEPAHGVIYFAAILFGANFIWNLAIEGDESNKAVMLFGVLNVTQPFVWMSHQIASSTAYILENWLNVPLVLNGTIIQFETNVALSIIWGCAGLKQMYIFFCIIAFYKGSWLHKLWYIPSGLVILHLFNIFRITVIAYFIKDNVNLMYLLHDHLFKYLFYGLIFLIWVAWEEIFVRRAKKRKPTKTQLP